MDLFDKNKSRESTCEHILKICYENDVFSNWIDVPDPLDKRNIRIHFITNRSIDTPYTEFEDSSTPVYILHGTAGTSVQYIEIMKRFKEERLVVAIDIPGYGISDNPTWYNEKAEIIFDNIGKVIIEAIKKITGSGKVMAIGVSIGAYFYISAINQEPKLFRQALFMVSPGVFPTLGKYGYYWGLLFSLNIPIGIFSHPFLRVLFYPLLKLLVNKNRVPLLYNSYSNNINYLRSFIRRIQNKMIWTHPQLDTVLTLPVPIAFVYGDEDTIIPYHQGHILCKLHSHIYTYTMKHTGHFVSSKVNEWEIIMRDQLSRSDLIYEVGLKCIKSLKTIKDICRGDDLYYASLSPTHTETVYNKCYEILYNISKDYKYIIDRTTLSLGIDRYRSYIAE
jgi:pimeloyl-ACP methyl ester carboxylesterase